MMSWEQLMEHANEIQSKAVMHAVNHHETDPEYARNGVDGYYQNVPDLFRPFADMPDPARYQPMIDDLRTVLKGLSNGDNNGDPIDVKDTYLANPAMTKIATAGDYLDDWTGTAALAFKQRFLDPFPAVARNQFILVAVLKAGLEAHQSMWHSARADIDNVAHTTIDALDNTGGWSDKNQWNFTFTVLASVAAVATVPLDAATEGMTIPLTVTAIGAAAQVVATTPPSELPDKNSGETAIQITNSMKAAMDRIVNEIHTTESKIASALTAMNQMASANNAYFVAPRPALANLHGSAETGSAGLGDHG
jgi:hypothetical protein